MLKSGAVKDPYLLSHSGAVVFHCVRQLGAFRSQATGLIVYKLHGQASPPALYIFWPRQPNTQRQYEEKNFVLP